MVLPSKPRLRWVGAVGLGLLGFVTMTVTLRAPLRASVLSLGRWAAATLAPTAATSVPTIDDAVAATQAPEGMALIRGQTFKMGSTKEEAEAAYQECTKYSKDCERHEFQRELPLRTVTLRSFYLDKYEVTNRQFTAWLNVHARQPTPRDDGMVFARSEVVLANYWPETSKIVFRDGKYSARSGQEDLPATQLTWPAASQYCQSQGKQLPTEAQWELAARGLLAQTALSPWPWGTEPPRCDGVVMDRGSGGACQQPNPGPERVGTAQQDVTASGVHDLGGNVHEWVQDRFVIPYPDCGACVDPSAPDPEQSSQNLRYRVLRGGSYEFNATLTRAAWRNRKQELETSPSIGFRCAAAVR
jgi:iron(II)-dependent oxidoreductase